MQRWIVQNFTFILEWGQGTCSLTKQTRLWIYSALRYFFPACCLVRCAAFFSTGPQRTNSNSQTEVQWRFYSGKIEIFWQRMMIMPPLGKSMSLFMVGETLLKEKPYSSGSAHTGAKTVKVILIWKPANMRKIRAVVDCEVSLLKSLSYCKRGIL